MFAAKAIAADSSSERKVLLAGMLVAIMAVALLLIMFLEQTDVSEHQAYFLVVIENAAVIIIFGATAFAAPLALREMRQRREATLGALATRLQVELLSK